MTTAGPQEKGIHPSVDRMVSHLSVAEVGGGGGGGARGRQRAPPQLALQPDPMVREDTMPLWTQSPGTPFPPTPSLPPSACYCGLGPFPPSHLGIREAEAVVAGCSEPLAFSGEKQKESILHKGWHGVFCPHGQAASSGGGPLGICFFPDHLTGHPLCAKSARVTKWRRIHRPEL